MRFVGALLLAFAAFALARGVGIPAWRTFPPGDASDIAMLVFLGSIWLTDRDE